MPSFITDLLGRDPQKLAKLYTTVLSFVHVVVFSHSSFLVSLQISCVGVRREGCGGRLSHIQL